MSYEEVADKFRQCADYAQWPETKAMQIIEFVKGLENVPDMRQLTVLYTV
jgi:hypothetical protein